MPNAETDRIAAIATAPGRGGIGIVRVSGPELAGMARALTGKIPQPRHATFARFTDAAGTVIDEGLVLYFPAPHSFTGEDVLEVHAHGGPVVLQMLLRRCLELGARLAEPGEFTRRAFLNDKLDLAQAEAVIDLIDAANEAAVKSAGRSLRGEFSRAIDMLVERLIELRMRVEAALDFPEEEIDALERREVEQGLNGLIEAVAEVLRKAEQGSLLRTGLNVVLAGQPNVGKSSLLNRLAGEELAIVTDIPGTTRDTVRQTIQVHGLPVNIIDTAGLRETEDTVERIGIDRTWKAIQDADLVLLLVDARTGVTPEDERIVAQLPGRLPRIVVYNKVDLRDEAAPEATADEVWISAKTGAGIEALRNRLQAAAGWQAESEDVFLARERHLLALREAQAALHRAAAVSDQAEF
ncbi:MAG: tRNA uridine-5-carboxymethylaminomethyl(34) synthesis GTPase MnmE, partial [Burkholderiales bacterium]|nr:tRNA uridine-5-carboxymethylaminomethyl(34) synthesis GTPase MnmE [Burkholderiales bacterium]